MRQTWRFQPTIALVAMVDSCHPAAPDCHLVTPSYHSVAMEQLLRRLGPPLEDPEEGNGQESAWHWET